MVEKIKTIRISGKDLYQIYAVAFIITSAFTTGWQTAIYGILAILSTMMSILSE